MAEIPKISITQVEATPDDSLANEDEDFHGNKYHAVLTDVEDLESDDQLKRCNKQSRKLKVNIRKGLIEDAGTDVEDYNDSGSEEDIDKNTDAKYDSHFELSEFLDQGYVDESMNVSTGAGGKTGTKRSNNFKSGLNVNESDLGALTDYENVVTSDEEIMSTVATPEKYNDHLRLADEISTISIHDSVSNNKEREYRLKSPMSSDSEIEDTAPRRYRGKCSGQRCAQPSYYGMHDVEEIYVESSDAEDHSAVRNIPYPEIDITFRRDPVGSKKFSRSRRSHQNKTSAKKTNTLLQCNKDDEGHTDIENLNSSDDDDTSKQLLIPTAYFKSDNMPLTDVEDFDIGDDDNLPEVRYKDIKMPSPLREMTLVRENASGSPSAKVMPIPDANFLGIQDSYVDKGLTDTEDMSDNEQDYYEHGKYTIENLPDIDCGIVHNSESVRPLQMKIRKFDKNTCEPLTDTEDLNMDATNVRRKKSKTKSSSHKARKFLDVRYIPAVPTTDLEDLYMSDGNETVLPAPNNAPTRLNRSDGTDFVKTDTECISGDEDYDGSAKNMIEIDPSVIANESFFSTVSARDGCLNTSNQRMFCNIEKPIVRKVSPSPDTYMAFTDTEDMQIISDTDDLLSAHTYSRAETVTPVDIQFALNDSGNSVVHYKNRTVFDRSNEGNHIKGHKDYQEAATDVEFLDEDNVEMAVACDEEPNEETTDKTEVVNRRSEDVDSTKGDVADESERPKKE